MNIMSNKMYYFFYMKNLILQYVFIIILYEKYINDVSCNLVLRKVLKHAHIYSTKTYE